MRLSTNLNSLNIYRNQRKNLQENSESLNRITSGKNLLYAKDNPNKVGQSNTLQIKIRSLEAASRNVQDTNSMMQATEGSIDAIQNSLIRMKELVVKANNGSNTVEDKITIQKEIDSIKNGIDEVVRGSGFNGTFPIMDTAVTDNNSPREKVFMGGSEVGDEIKLKTYNLSTKFLVGNNGTSIKDLDVIDEIKGQEALSVIDDIVGMVNVVRSEYGAVQMRLEGSTEYLSENINLSERSVSSISDADLAKEMMSFSRTSILAEASMGLMAQSNRLPKEILGILERVK